MLCAVALLAGSVALVVSAPGRANPGARATVRPQAAVEPVYETFEGWQAATAKARSWAGLPAQAIKYVRHVEELVGFPVALLSTSPEREDTILMQNPFEN